VLLLKQISKQNSIFFIKTFFFYLDFTVEGYFRRSPPAATGGNLQNNPKTADSCCSPANTKQFTLKLQTKLQKVVAGLTVENEN